MTTKPASTFATLARQMPASGLQTAGKPAHTANLTQNTCSICGTALKPSQAHVPGGFECRQNTGQL